MSNLLISLLACHNTMKEEERKYGKIGLSVFVMPTAEINGFNQYYAYSKSATERSRGPITPITDTRDMVNQLLQIQRQQQAQIDFLSITAHGTATYLGSWEGVFLIGSDKITLSVLQNPADPVTMELTRLRGVFTPDALVELRACFIGQELTMLKELSMQLGGVRVQASRWIQYGTYAGLTGPPQSIVECKGNKCAPLLQPPPPLMRPRYR